MAPSRGLTQHFNSFPLLSKSFGRTRSNRFSSGHSIRLWRQYGELKTGIRICWFGKRLSQFMRVNESRCCWWPISVSQRHTCWPMSHSGKSLRSGLLNGCASYELTDRGGRVSFLGGNGGVNCLETRVPQWTMRSSSVASRKQSDKRNIIARILIRLLDHDTMRWDDLYIAQHNIPLVYIKIVMKFWVFLDGFQ